MFSLHPCTPQTCFHTSDVAVCLPWLGARNDEDAVLGVHDGVRARVRVRVPVGVVVGVIVGAVQA